MLHRPHVLPTGAVAGDRQLELAHQAGVLGAFGIGLHLVPGHVCLNEQSEFHTAPIGRGSVGRGACCRVGARLLQAAATPQGRSDVSAHPDAVPRRGAQPHRHAGAGGSQRDVARLSPLHGRRPGAATRTGVAARLGGGHDDRRAATLRARAVVVARHAPAGGVDPVLEWSARAGRDHRRPARRRRPGLGAAPAGWPRHGLPHRRRRGRHRPGADRLLPARLLFRNGVQPAVGHPLPPRRFRLAPQQIERGFLPPEATLPLPVHPLQLDFAVEQDWRSPHCSSGCRRGSGTGTREIGLVFLVAFFASRRPARGSALRFHTIHV